MPWYAICKERLKNGTASTTVGKHYRVKRMGPETIKVHNVESTVAIDYGQPAYMLITPKSARHHFDEPYWED